MPRVFSKSPTPVAGGSNYRLNLGCGVIALEGWENYDRSPVMLLRRVPALRNFLVKAKILAPGHIQEWPAIVQRRDLTKPLPFPDGVVEAIYSSHMLEHIYFDEARALLVESFRVMKPGGVIRVALPDGDLWARQLVQSEGDGDAGRRYNERLGAYPNARPKGRRMVAFIGGGSAHKWQPTRGVVREIIEAAGFTDVRERTFRDGNLPQLDEVEVREESMFFEAVRAR